MNVLITGITGQAGSYLAELMLNNGHQVIGIKRRSSTITTLRINPILNRIKVIEGDITDSHDVYSWFTNNEIDWCVNCAAQSHVATSFNQPQLTYNVNCNGVLNILEGIKRFSPGTRLVQFSTSEMFGSNYSRVGNYMFQDEETPFAPQSPYAISKVAAHYLVQLYRKSYGLHASCAINFNFESPRRGEEFVTRKITRWVGEFVNWANASGYTSSSVLQDSDYIYGPNNSRFPKLRLGNLAAYRDWGHAKDVCNAVYLMLEQDEPDDYVVSTGNTYQVSDFLTEVFDYIKYPDWKNFVVIDQAFFRPAEVDYLLGNSDKIRNNLNWKPKYTFKQLVAEMVDSDIKHAKKTY